jgi:hypothetical protein
MFFLPLNFRLSMFLEGSRIGDRKGIFFLGAWIGFNRPRNPRDSVSQKKRKRNRRMKIEKGGSRSTVTFAQSLMRIMRSR